MIEKPPDPGHEYPDTPDGKMFSKASKVLQEHNRVNTPQSYKQNGLHKENYGSHSDHIFDRHNGHTYVRGKLLGKVSY